MTSIPISALSDNIIEEIKPTILPPSILQVWSDFVVTAMCTHSPLPKNPNSPLAYCTLSAIEVECSGDLEWSHFQWKLLCQCTFDI